MRSTIRVLVVDDSALVRQMLTRAISLDPRIEVVGHARTGVEAIEKARELKPDVITLDIEMPELSGLEALPHLNKHADARVVMLSSLDDPDTTYKALSSGAVDFLAKPRQGFATSINDLAEVLLKKIKTAYRVDPQRVTQVMNAVAAEDEIDAGARSGARTGVEVASIVKNVVAIAASTGGPPALERVFSGLNATLPAVYLIVQHLPPGFSASLARRISSVGDIEAVEAGNGMPLRPGTAYIAPHGAHMLVGSSGDRNGRIILEETAPVHGLCPAADPLFESVAKTYGRRSIGVVLTGMGSDGAQGLNVIKAAGGETIAQNEPTSVVWGMPGAAARMGAVRHTVPIGLVAAEIRRSMRGKVSA